MNVDQGMLGRAKVMTGLASKLICEGPELSTMSNVTKEPHIVENMRGRDSTHGGKTPCVHNKPRGGELTSCKLRISMIENALGRHGMDP